MLLLDASKEFINVGGIEESKKLLKQASNKPNVIFNVISLLTTISHDGKYREMMYFAIQLKIAALSSFTT